MGEIEKEFHSCFNFIQIHSPVHNLINSDKKIMSKANKFSQSWHTFSALFLLFFLSTIFPAWAEEIKSNPTLSKGGEWGFFNLEVTDNLINLQAE